MNTTWYFLLTQYQPNQRQSVSTSVEEQAESSILTLFNFVEKIFLGLRVLTILVTLYTR